MIDIVQLLVEGPGVNLNATDEEEIGCALKYTSAVGISMGIYLDWEISETERNGCSEKTASFDNTSPSN
jgi:hypothetical protein